MKKPLFKNLSIKIKLVLIILITSITAIFIGLTISLTYDMMNVRKELKQNALFNATLVGQYSAAPLLFGYKEEAGEVLSKLETLPEILDACLFVPGSKEVFTSYQKVKEPGFSFPVPKKENAEFIGPYLHVFHEIRYKGQDCGTIYFRLSALNVRDRLINSLLLAGSILVLIIIVVSFIANRLQKLISEPILNLATIAQKISDNNDYSERLTYSGDDEINSLYRHFDNMVQQIFQKKKERDIAENQLKIMNTQLSTELSERKQIETSLRNSEEKYRYLFERNPASMVIYDRESLLILAANEAFMNHYGFAREEIYMMRYSDIFVPEERKAITETIKSLKGYAQTGEWHHLKKDGSPMSVITTSHELFYLSRKARVVVITDITERQKAENEVNFLAQVLRNINEFVSITDSNNIVSFVNQSWLEAFGYSEKEIIGKNINLIVSQSNRPSIEKEILEATLKGGWHGEIINRKKNGMEFPVALSTTIIYDKDDNPIALVGISSDITEQKKTQDELNNHRKNLEQLIQARTAELNSLMKETADLYENAPCGYHSLDEKGFFVRMNKTELDWLGYTREELINKMGSGDIMTAASREKFKKVFPEFLKSGEVRNIEFEYVRKDGSTFFGSLSATAIKDEDGKFIRSRSTLFDITERIRFEYELNRAMEAAEKANLAKSEFLASMSHEIRTPMNAVLGYTELLSSLLTDKAQKNYIDSIRSSGRSLLTLINDILDLSKIEAGKLDLEFDYIDSANFFNEFEKIFALKASEKGIRFYVEIASGTPAGIYVDEPRLRQIIFNLVGNAIKFTQKGFVRLFVHIENPQTIIYNEDNKGEYIDLVIEVEDSGIGISKEIREEIFDPFIQARDHRSIGGTGLGLAITRRLTNLMKGTISLESELGKGSTFKVTIPDVAYKNDFYQPNISLKINTGEIEFGQASILVVDDVEFNRTYIHDVLKETKIKVIQAEDGFRALEILKGTSPDVIISDIRMPLMDGFEFLDKVKSDKKLKSIPVIAYSASVLKDQKERIHNSEFVALLTKPVNISDLYIELMKLIPYREIKKTTVDNSIQTGNELSEIDDLQGLIKKLESELFTMWKTFEVRQPINEIRSFGSALEAAGDHHKAGIISDYGKELRSATETFDIKAIISLIKQYPTIIDRLKVREDVP
jgi:PAS domain S-box-containing protein